MPYSFYEFFAGAGLARLGLGDEWSCLWANDNNPKKEAVYTHNFGHEHFVLGDVAKVDPSSLPPGADLAWASFPCQDLSLAGWRRGMQAPRSGVFWAFWRLMSDLHNQGAHPPVIVLENVLGLLRGDNLRGLCEALAALNMRFGALVIDAKYFLPQSRPRVFIIAVDASTNVEPFTDKRPIRSPWAPTSLLNAYDTMPQYLRSLWHWWRLPVPTAPVTPLAELIEDVPDGAGWHTAEETGRLLSMMTETNRGKIQQVDLSTGQAVGTLYRRIRDNVQRAEVRFDGTAGCLRTPVGGSSRQTVVVAEQDRVRSRLLTTREAARLMGVPDTFWLPANYNDAYLAMGDGVAVPAVSWLSTHLLTSLAAAVHSQRESPMAQKVVSNGHHRLAAHHKRAERLATQWEIVRQ